MRKSLLLIAAAMLCGMTVNAQTDDSPYKTLDIYAGFDADVFTDQTSSDSHPQFVKGVDDAGVGFYTSPFSYKVYDFQGISPDQLPFVGPSGSQYSFDVTKLNALSLSNVEASENRPERSTTGTLTLAKPVKADELWFLACCGNGPANLDVTLNYTDGTTSDPTPVEVLDWWDKGGEPNCVLAGLDRADRISKSTDQRHGVTFLEYNAYGDAEKEIQSVTFELTNPDGHRVVTILGLSANGESLDITDGLTDDVIAEAMPLNETSTIGIDQYQWVVLMTGIDFSEEGEPALGVPKDGKVTTVANADGNYGDIPFQLAPFDQLNATRLTYDDGDTEDVDESCDTLLVAGEPQATEIYLLGTAGNGPANTKVSFLYTDGSVSEAQTWSIPDWFGDESTHNLITGRYHNGWGDRNIEAYTNCGMYVELFVPDEKPIKGIICKNTAMSGQSKAIIVAATMNGDFTSGINSIGEVKKATNNAIYNVAGQRVGENYKGIVIRNGKKYIK